MEIKWVINCYDDTPDRLLPYTDNYVIYDKKEKNVGYNIYDYADYIVENYNKLPDVVVFAKSNMLERHITKEEWEKIKDNTTFTPILTQHHKTDGKINYYKDGLYYELNNSWYFNHFEHRFNSYAHVADYLGLFNMEYLGFAPGGCYIVPRDNILKYPKVFYEKIREMVGYTQLPAEAHAIERSLYNIWTLPH